MPDRFRFQASLKLEQLNETIVDQLLAGAYFGFGRIARAVSSAGLDLPFGFEVCRYLGEGVEMAGTGIGPSSRGSESNIASVAQPVAVVEMNWCLPWGNPVSK